MDKMDVGCNENSTVLLISECYSEQQNNVITYLGASTALISFVCSLFIIQHVLRSKKLKTYHRLLIGLSFWDVVSSSTNFGSAFSKPLTRGYDGTAGTVGCTANGFILVISVGGAAMYNACLALFFWLVVQFQVKDQTIATRYEPIFHVVANAYSLSLGISGLVLQALNPQGVDQGCWFAPYPAVEDCDDGDCWERGGKSAWKLLDTIVFSFYGVAGILLLANLSMYCKVRRTEQRNARFQSQPVRLSLSRTSQPSNERRRALQVAVQSFLFFGGFVLTYQFTVVRVLMSDYVGTKGYYVISVLAGMFWPLQGFFDFVVYFRPRYLQWRRRNPARGRWFAVKKTTLTVDSPTITMVSRRKPTSWRAKPVPQRVVLDEEERGRDVLSEGPVTTTDNTEETMPPPNTVSGIVVSESPFLVDLSCCQGVRRPVTAVADEALQRTEQERGAMPFTETVLDETDERIAETLQFGANTWYAAKHLDST